LHTLSEHTDGVKSVEFSIDSKVVVSASWDRSAKLWNVETGVCVKSFDGHTNGVYHAAFSPDGKRIASSSWDRSVRIWNIETLQSKIFKMDSEVHCATFSYNDRHILTSSWDSSIKILDSDSGEIVSTLGENTYNNKSSVFFLNDSPRATSNFAKKICSFNCSNFSDNSLDNNLISTLLMLNGRSLFHNNVAFTDDNDSIVFLSFDDALQAWRQITPFLTDALKGDPGLLRSFALSRKGKLILSGSKNGVLKLWDMETRKPLHEIIAHASGVNSASFNNNCTMIVSASTDGTVKTWDPTTGKPIGKPVVHDSAVRCSQFSNNGQWVISLPNDGTAIIWNVFSGETVGVLKNDISFDSVSFSSNDNLIVTSSENAIKIWKWKGNRPVLKFNPSINPCCAARKESSF